MGELFPGCPAIVPASAPLIEKHEKESNQAKGAGDRANSAAAVDTAAASMRSIGLLAFALIGSTSLRVALRRYSCVRNICLVLDINTKGRLEAAMLLAKNAEISRYSDELRKTKTTPKNPPPAALPATVHQTRQIIGKSATYAVGILFLGCISSAPGEAWEGRME
jgi:hypothetical protein